jgi:hypothetical protein
MTADRDRWSRRRYRIAFVAATMLLVGIIVTVPFSLGGVIDEMLGPATGKIIPLLRAPAAGIAPTHTRLHLAVIAVDEVRLAATLRVSGHHTCNAPCSARDRLLFVSIARDDGEAEGLPPSASLALPEANEAVSETIELPVRGFPIRYPFDSYHMVLGVLLQRIHPDGHVQTLGPDQAPRHLLLSVQALLPQKRMSPPLAVDPRSVRTPGSSVEYAAAYAVSFARPRYLRVLAVLLVLLIAAAAVYSVLLRALEDLLVNAGALVLGVWGVRSILVPVNLHFLTAVDLSLSMVILFLLGGVTVKVLMLAHDRGDLHVLRWPRWRAP